MATAVAAIIAKARRDIQHVFFSQDAVRPERAIAFEPDRHIQWRQFEAMRDRGIIQEASPGRYWLNVVDYDVDLRHRHATVRTLLIALILLLMIGLVLPYFTR